MPRPARPWFRFYVESMHDWKIRRLTPTERWVWVAILSFARESCIPGFLMVSDKHALSEDELAFYADVPLKVVQAALTRIEDFGMIERDHDLQSWHVTQWNDRQFESDDVTARTSKHRSKEQGRNVPTSLVGTPPETETETESYTETELLRAFDRCWEIFPRKIARKPAFNAYKTLRKRGATEEQLFRATGNFADAMRKERRAQDKIMYGSTFYGPNERWVDYVEEPTPTNNEIVAVGAQAMEYTPGMWGGEIVTLPGEQG